MCIVRWSNCFTFEPQKPCSKIYFLQVGAFKLSVKRDVGKIKSTTATPQATPPPVPSRPMVDSLPAAPPAPASAPKTSTSTSMLSSVSKPLSSVFALLESAADEGLLFVKSPKVFRVPCLLILAIPSFNLSLHASAYCGITNLF